MRIVAVTSCITGIAHTYMAAEALEQAAKAAGHDIRVETQGASGAEKVDDRFIASADVAIFAHELPVSGKERFDGIPQVEAPVNDAVNHPEALIARAVSAAQSGGETSSTRPRPVTQTAPEHVSSGRLIMNRLLAGVSYMIPFVAAGGILIALGFIVGGIHVSNAYGIDSTTKIPLLWENFQLGDNVWWGALLFWVGKASFSFLVPALAGYIAFAIADRPGLVPGFSGGLIATQVGAGFLGGIVAGFLAGYLAMWIMKVPLGKALQSLKPVVIVPLFATVVTGALMYTVIGVPAAWLMTALSHGVEAMASGTLVIAGLVMGAMMGFDLGGPVNKAASLTAVAGITTALAAATYNPDNVWFILMAACMGAGMSPPIGMALATVLDKRHYTKAERDNGKAAWLLGASYITEGAIPFAAADPLRIIPATVAGSALTGLLASLFRCASPAPHGGIWVVGVIGNPLLWVLAIVAGSALTCAVAMVTKRIGHPADLDVA